MGSCDVGVAVDWAGGVATASGAGLPGDSIVNEKDPSIGWASGAFTIHLTPVGPGGSGVSNLRIHVLPSVLDADVGANSSPVESRI